MARARMRMPVVGTADAGAARSRLMVRRLIRRSVGNHIRTEALLVARHHRSGDNKKASAGALALSGADMTAC